MSTLWVCQDCLFADVNGSAPDYTPDREPWCEISDDRELSVGLVAEEHECDFEAGEWEECSCEVREFSWRRCDGCGSTLGGSRHAFTLDDATVRA